MTKLFGNAVVRQYLVILSANLSTLCLGLSVAWTSPMLVKLTQGDGTGLRPVSDEEGSWVASVGILVSIPVHFVIGYLSDKIGRKTCLVMGCVPRLSMCVTLLCASEVWMVLLARAIDGLALGSVLAVIAAYSSEVASKEVRGALGATCQVSSAAGMLVFLGVAPFLSYFHVNLAFFCISAAVCVPLCLLPESPYYLYSKGRTEESLKVLTYLRASESLAHDEITQYELSRNEATNSLSVKEILKDCITLRTVGKVIVMSVLLELTGYNAVLFHMMTIFKLSATSVSDDVSSVVIGCIQLLACLFTISLTDWIGRKPILVATLCGMAVGMVGLGTFFYLKDQDYIISGALNFMPLISMILVIFSFNAGLGSLFWTLLAELFDSHARAVGVSIGTFTAATFVFLTTKYFVSVISSVGPALTYWSFSVVCILNALFVMICIPETKNKTFMEIQMELGRSFKTT